MKFIFGFLMVLVVLFPGSPVRAEEAEDGGLARLSLDINQTASLPEGPKTLVMTLERNLGTTDAQVAFLRSRKRMMYGEIVIAIALASQLPEGVTDAGVKRVSELRQGPPRLGWDEVARELEVKMGTVVSMVEKVAGESGKSVGKTASEKGKGKESGSGSGNGKSGTAHDKGSSRGHDRGHGR